MGKLSNWLIHKLGGYTRQEWNGGMAPKARIDVAYANIHPRLVKASYCYYVEPDTPEVVTSQGQMAQGVLAKKLAQELLESGMIQLRQQVDMIQDHPTAKKYRMTGAVWALDGSQMPFYGGGAG